MSDAPPTSPALSRIRAAHDAWRALAATDQALATAQAAPWALVLAQAGLPGKPIDWPDYLDAVAPTGKQVEAAAFRRLHMAASAEAHVRARESGPGRDTGCRAPNGTLDLAAFDKLSWEVFELEAAVRAIPPSWPRRATLAGIAASWRAPHDALRTEAARGHVAAVLSRPTDGDPDARLGDLAQLGFWAPKLATEDEKAHAAGMTGGNARMAIADHARSVVTILLASLEGAAPELAAWRPRVLNAPDDAPLRAFEDAYSRRARVLAERLGDPRQSGAWGSDVTRTGWRDRAEAAAAGLEAPLGALALDWAAATLDRLEAAVPVDRVAVVRVQEWLQRVPDGEPRLAALAARCAALDAGAGRMWRDRRLEVIRERGPRPEAPSITE